MSESDRPDDPRHLMTLLWKAATDSDRPLNQGIDAILQVKRHAPLDLVPRQRRDPDGDSPSRAQTHADDQSWLDDLVERHRREQL